LHKVVDVEINISRGIGTNEYIMQKQVIRLLVIGVRCEPRGILYWNYLKKMFWTRHCKLAYWSIILLISLTTCILCIEGLLSRLFYQLGGVKWVHRIIKAQLILPGGFACIGELISVKSVYTAMLTFKT
jgi:hypothetical protein